MSVNNAPKTYIYPKDKKGSRDYLGALLNNARLNFRWKQALRLWPVIANLASTTIAVALVMICILSGTNIGRFPTLYIFRISLHETELIDDIKNVVKSSTIAEKVLGALLGNADVPNELSIHLTAYCVVPRSMEIAKPPRCVPTSFRYYVYGGFAALLIVSLWSIIFPRTRPRNDKSSWSPLQIAWALILAAYTHLALDVVVISYNLAHGIHSDYLTIEQGSLFMGLVGAVYICLAAVLVISSKDVIPGFR